MTCPFHTARTVEFQHTDAAGIMHFSRFLTMMEEAEHELLRTLGLSVFAQDDDGPISWPRASVRCDFRGAVRFEDRLDIEVSLARLGEKSATYRFLFRHEGRTVAEGEIVAVCCRLFDDKPPESIPIPDWIAEKLRPALGS